MGVFMGCYIMKYFWFICNEVFLVIFKFFFVVLIFLQFVIRDEEYQVYYQFYQRMEDGSWNYFFNDYG